ncbi:hypothetical protein [Kitasatospora mediocidica]|uniref:hypothetical protein n=1 Tax=Kitasatospora mediocidica TaxID=58352 RepID=UPI000567D665|nr:hypothetical protein [Kitasatospora mediocidica]
MDGQTGRHGNQHTTRKESSAEALAAVHLGATLVQYFSSVRSAMPDRLAAKGVRAVVAGYCA